MLLLAKANLFLPHLIFLAWRSLWEEPTGTLVRKRFFCPKSISWTGLNHFQSDQVSIHNPYITKTRDRLCWSSEANVSLGRIRRRWFWQEGTCSGRRWLPKSGIPSNWSAARQVVWSLNHTTKFIFAASQVQQWGLWRLNVCSPWARRREGDGQGEQGGWGQGGENRFARTREEARTSCSTSPAD